MNGFTGLITGTDGAEKQISSGINSLIKNITTALPTALDAITSIVSGVTSVLPDLVVTLADAIIGALPTLGNTFMEVGGKLLDAITQVLPKMLDAGLKLIIQLAQGITPWSGTFSAAPKSWACSPVRAERREEKTLEKAAALTDSFLSALHLPRHTSQLPLSPHLLGVRPAGGREIRRCPGVSAGRQAAEQMPSLP
jgi:hypothetical protein